TLPKPTPWAVRTSAEDLSALTDPNWVAAALAGIGPQKPTDVLTSVAELVPAPPKPGKYLLIREAVKIKA
ncbi:hypothetical protein HKX48_009013, partial [Thoreauomyces humboldtii]